MASDLELKTAEAVQPARQTATRGAARLGTAHRTRDLLWMLTAREITIRYKQSVMGLFWALLMPTMVVAAGLAIRVVVARISATPLAPEAVAAIMVKSLPWAFFVSALRACTSSLTANSNLVTRANCPRIVFPLSAVLASLFDLAVAVVPLAIALSWVGVSAGPHALLAAPLLLILTALTGGLGLILATANLYYRDVRYIVEVLLMFAIFFTPVLFEVDMLGEWKGLAMLNPVAPLLESLYQVVVLARPPDWNWVAYSCIATLVVATFGWALFRRLEPTFADNI